MTTTTTTKPTVSPHVLEQIARVCHEANRAYAQTLGQLQPPWGDAASWQWEATIAGVRAIADGLVASPAQCQQRWIESMVADGWTYGPVRDAAKKQHPGLVAYDDLPAAERAKDALFFAVASTLLTISDPGTHQ